MPYTQEQYQRARESLKDPALPPQSRKIRETRIAEFEDAQDRGFQTASLAAGQPNPTPIEAPAQPTLGEVGAQFGGEFLANSQGDTAQVIKAAMPYAELEARQQAVNTAKKLARDETLRTASKLKVFSDPPDYSPPAPLPGALGTGLNALRPTTRYFEPTLNEFRNVLAGNNRVAERVRAEYPDVAKLDELSDANLLHSEAYRAYSDARWQYELAEAMKSKTPIIRVQYSDKDWMSGNKPAESNEDTLAAGMDATMALGSGVLQGGTSGGWDAGLTAAGGTKLRDAGRGSRDRYSKLGIVGEVAGALHPRSLVSKLTGGLGRLAAPASLPGRVLKAGVVGAASGVLDENIRRSADLAADAMDAEASISETFDAIRKNLTFNPMTAVIGGGLGAVGDAAGAALGAGSRAMREGDRLRVPLGDYERGGGKLGPLMGRKLSPEALELRGKAEAKGTTPAAYVADEVKQPLARQRLLEQEDLARTEAQANSRAQARLEGVEVPVLDTVERIRALKLKYPGGTPGAIAARNQIDTFADDLLKSGNLRADQIDDRLQRVDNQAGFSQQRGEPKDLWVDIGREVRELRDELKFRDDATVVTTPEDKGLFTGDPDVTVATPEPKQVGAIRDQYGNVKPVEDYSAEKLRQSRIKEFYQKSNKRMGLPEELQAESALSDPYVSKGVFDPKTPQQVAESLPVKVKFSSDEDKAFVSGIQNASKKENFRSREEVDALASRADKAGAELSNQTGDLASHSELATLAARAGVDLAPSLKRVRELESAGELGRALGEVVEGISSSGNFGVNFLKKIGYHSIPTLESLAAGLPERALKPSDLTLTRFKKFITTLTPGRALKEGAKGVARGTNFKKAPQKSFIPTLPGAGLRGGLPARATGAYQDQEESVPEFTQQEADFWLKVLDNLARSKAGN